MWRYLPSFRAANPQLMKGQFQAESQVINSMFWQGLTKLNSPMIIPLASLWPKPFELDLTMLVKIDSFQIREANSSGYARFNKLCGCLNKIHVGDIQPYSVIVEAVCLLYLQVSWIERHHRISLI
ncbi:hypothetical protein DNK08_05505 [Stutzerimonas kirkiae]|nr:hypothetical protein DNK08_05505 [Stutzerimonas kirkiae]